MEGGVISASCDRNQCDRGKEGWQNMVVVVAHRRKRSDTGTCRQKLVGSNTAGRGLESIQR